MAHFEQTIFCSVVRGLFPRHFAFKKVLDIGSLNVNGANRSLFWFCQYTGLDLAPGRNVDIVCPGHLWRAPGEYYDVIISTECGEHDRHYPATISNILRMLKPGGLLIYTCATTDRPEHGTRRTDCFSSPFTQDYYKNLTEMDLRQIPGFNDQWRLSRFQIDEYCHDLRFWGIKKGAPFKFRPRLWSYVAAQLQFFTGHRAADARNYFRRNIGIGLL